LAVPLRSLVLLDIVYQHLRPPLTPP
jgi:hypothetical protein